MNFTGLTEYEVECDQVSKERYNPGDGEGTVNPLRAVELGQREDDQHPENPEEAHTQHGHEHGQYRAAKSPEDTNDRFHHAAQEVGDTIDGDVQKTVRNGFIRVINIDGEQLPSENFSGTADN